MSSCAAFCSTCCRADLCVSATSAFLPTGDERNFSHCVSTCSSNQSSHQHAPFHRLPPPLPCYGLVPSAAESCALSSGFPLRNSSSGLRPIPDGAQHEFTSPASNLPRAPARTVPLCSLFPKTRSCPSVQALQRTTPQRFCLRIPIDAADHPPHWYPRSRSELAQAHTNPRGPEGGFLQVAVSEAPTDITCRDSPSLMGASDTALRHHESIVKKISSGDNCASRDSGSRC